MGDSISESSSQSDVFKWGKINKSFFSTSGFFVGFSAKSSVNTETVRSPTSPLDYKLFSSLSNPFSFKTSRSSSQYGSQKKWDCSKVGLGIINSLNEAEPIGEVLDSTVGKNIIFGPQVKKNTELLDFSMKSNSLPWNYMISPVSKTIIPNPQFSSSGAFENEEVQLEPACKNTESCSQNLDPSSQNVCSENRNAIMSLPEKILDIKPSSLPNPISIGTSHAYVGSFSAREIELSEDYTCIISHGPNPKTTHIFGDCVLECCTNELAKFGKKEERRIELDDGSTHLSDEFPSFCHWCKKKIGEGKYLLVWEKAFCSFECRSEEIFVQEEIEKVVSDATKSSPESSCHEDLFLMCMPIAE